MRGKKKTNNNTFVSKRLWLNIFRVTSPVPEVI